jgi:hypothetical protein
MGGILSKFYTFAASKLKKIKQKQHEGIENHY